MGFFRKGPPSQAAPESPALLFRDLRNKDPQVKFIWAHQQQVLDAFHGSFMNRSDVALELPTYPPDRHHLT
jgi:hypothetical protein